MREVTTSHLRMNTAPWPRNRQTHTHTCVLTYVYTYIHTHTSARCSSDHTKVVRTRTGCELMAPVIGFCRASAASLTKNISECESCGFTMRMRRRKRNCDLPECLGKHHCISSWHGAPWRRCTVHCLLRTSHLGCECAPRPDVLERYMDDPLFHNLDSYLGQNSEHA